MKLRYIAHICKGECKNNPKNALIIEGAKGYDDAFEKFASVWKNTLKDDDEIHILRIDISSGQTHGVGYFWKWKGWKADFIPA